MTSYRPVADRLNVLCWEGYDDPAYLRTFENRHGCCVRGETFDSDMHAVGQVRSSPEWDVINVNNPYARACLFPENLIVPLESQRFAYERERLLTAFEDFFACGWSTDGGSMLGVCQRFGPFNLVINSDALALKTASSEGFSLADDAGHAKKFGLLDYPEFNVMHAAIACDVNPFLPMTEATRKQVAAKLARWKTDALIVTNDHHELNRALVEGDIRFYLSGGRYTAAVARMAGHVNIAAVTPDAGPIEGRGGVAFVEVTSLCRAGSSSQLAEHFLHFMLEPEQCHAIALAKGTHNPVAQMGDAQVMRRFSSQQLEAIQWDTLASDMSKCAPYAIIPEFEGIQRLAEALIENERPARPPG